MCHLRHTYGAICNLVPVEISLYQEIEGMALSVAKTMLLTCWTPLEVLHQGITYTRLL